MSPAFLSALLFVRSLEFRLFTRELGAFTREFVLSSLVSAIYS
ncbi:hypothetical protein SRABI96_04116 [Peribacillus sp. Bi96]|nr:hypothetical protein [Peribacillus sp. Bi96]CAH0286006.1 hypothetical protein SRABI96_04116 [Peribacillus sp. Bi96]